MVRKLTALGRGNLRLRSAARSSSTPIDAEAAPSEAPPQRAGGFGRSPGVPDSSNQRRLSQRLINRIHHRRGPPPPEPNEDDAIGSVVIPVDVSGGGAKVEVGRITLKGREQEGTAGYVLPDFEVSFSYELAPP